MNGEFAHQSLTGMGPESAATEAILSGRDQIEIWVHGEQSRSFGYIGDCVHEERSLTDSDVTDPVNIVGSKFVSVIDDLERPYARSDDRCASRAHVAG